MFCHAARLSAVIAPVSQGHRVDARHPHFDSQDYADPPRIEDNVAPRVHSCAPCVQIARQSGSHISLPLLVCREQNVFHLSRSALFGSALRAHKAAKAVQTMASLTQKEPAAHTLRPIKSCALKKFIALCIRVTPDRRADRTGGHLFILKTRRYRNWTTNAVQLLRHRFHLHGIPAV